MDLFFSCVIQCKQSHIINGKRRIQVMYKVRSASAHCIMERFLPSSSIDMMSVTPADPGKEKKVV